MKPSLCFGAALGLLAWPFATPGAEITPAGYQPMRIDQTWEPNFPIQATNLDLTSGEANVIVTIDGDGRLTDSLVVSYSHPAFADIALLALKKWKYEPARLDGQPLISTKEVAFRFEQHGLVLVTETAAEAIESKMEAMSRDATSYRAYTLNEIDRLPSPIHLVSPAYPPELRERGISGTVTLEYYVDENGRVRMPVVTNRPPAELANLAVAAAQQWQFDVPTRKGRPVLVRVSQNIHFKPAK